MVVTPYDHEFHKACCDEARSRGYPMGMGEGARSLEAFIPAGVVMSTIVYAHLANTSTRIFIALYTAYIYYLDDMFQNNVDSVKQFNERFIMREKQDEPALDSFAELLYEFPKHFNEVASKIMLTSTLNAVTALLLEYETREMKLATGAHSYASFLRWISGTSEVYALFAFPAEVPLQSYIQVLPELMTVVNNINDVLSFYKEDLCGETANRISVHATCTQTNKIEVQRQLVDEVVTAHKHASLVLGSDQAAYDAFIAFSTGCIGFHFSLPRYKLNQICDC
ncbi:terpenoid synthase [Pluteus cervinus]|uniref:Terpenoid synthase n=1 Tax=Pluteus cervinus TaxID=181527 RepID=A0ACD3ALY8_9AGAR|nr:terpenoid synthase [Pluteus cervinus]